MTESATLQNLKKKVGSVRLAKLLSDEGVPISSQAISQWHRVPSERVLVVEKVTGVSRHDLRPDLYPRDQAEMLA